MTDGASDSTTGTGPLDAETIATLRAAVDRDGETEVCRHSHCSRHTLARALAGLSIRAAFRETIRAAVVGPLSARSEGAST